MIDRKDDKGGSAEYSIMGRIGICPNGSWGTLLAVVVHLRSLMHLVMHRSHHHASSRAHGATDQDPR